MESRSKMKVNSFSLLPLTVAVLSLVSQLCFARDIYVDKERGTINQNCWEGGRENPCKTLDLALIGLSGYNHTTVWIESGSYTLNRTSPNNAVGFEYRYMVDIAIVALPEDNYTQRNLAVQVDCQVGAGLSFVYSRNITIKGVSFTGCGVSHNSTSRDPSNTSDLSMFATFYTAIYFQFCRDLTLQYIEVLHSAGAGIGAVLYSTVGTVLIQNSDFSHNTAPNGTNGGGGLYIEFAYCTPDVNQHDVNCSEGSNVPLEYTRDAVYTIDSSHFEGNMANVGNTTYVTYIVPQLGNHLAFGRGGGVSVFFKGECTNITVQVQGCQIHNNRALWGAGLFVEFQDNSHNNSFIMSSTVVESNSCYSISSLTTGTGGGGVRLGYVFFDQLQSPTHSHDNHMTFSGVNFTTNAAHFGGGMSFYTAKEHSELYPTNAIEFQECRWRSNIAMLGSAVDVDLWQSKTLGSLTKPVFTDCSFESHNCSYTSDTTSVIQGIGAFYSDSVPVEFVGSISFDSNNDTALAFVNTVIFFHKNCVANFTNNRGRKGGAIALLGTSYIQISEGTEFYFLNNFANIKGGAIYGQSVGEHDLLSSRKCFIGYEDEQLSPWEWKTKFYFENNVANLKNNSIYVTTLITCMWGRSHGPTEENVKHTFCWNDDEAAERWVYATGNCSDEIATSPAQFLPPNTSEPTNDSDVYSLSLIPGKVESVPISAVDDKSNSVTDRTVLSVNSLSPDLKIANTSLYITNNGQIKIYGHQNASGPLQLETTTETRVVSTQVDITMKPCPLGMYLNISTLGEEECQCADGNFRRHVKCDNLAFKVNVERGSWIGRAGHNQTVLAGHCAYCSFTNNDDSFVNLLDSESDLCEGNRGGVLCGSCKEGYAPAFNSEDFNCIRCPASKRKYSWIFFLLDCVPLMIFLLIILIFQVSVTSGPAIAYVFHAQVVTDIFRLGSDGTFHILDVKRSYNVIYGIWNLSFLRALDNANFCLGPDISTMTVISLRYITALLPLLFLALFITIVWIYNRNFIPKCTRTLCSPVIQCYQKFHRKIEIRRSIIHGLATFIVLSYTQFALVSLALLSGTYLVDSSGDAAQLVVFYDGNMEYGSSVHLPYIFIAVFVTLIFVCIPPIILMVPSITHFIQTTFKSLRHRDCPTLPLMTQFLDVFHGCYKDGTGKPGSGNERDYRYFAGLYLLLRCLLSNMYAYTPGWFVLYTSRQLVFTVAIVVFAYFRPYKRDSLNNVDAAMFANLSVINTLTMYIYFRLKTGQNISDAAFYLRYISIMLPFLCMCAYIGYNLYSYCKQKHPRSRARDYTELTNHSDSFIDHVERAGRMSDTAARAILYPARVRNQRPLNNPCINNPAKEEEKADKKLLIKTEQ